MDVLGEVMREMEIEHLKAAIERLPERARYVLERRYGLDDGDPATRARPGEELEISRERLRQLQREVKLILKSGARCAMKPAVPDLGRKVVSV